MLASPKRMNYFFAVMVIFSIAANLAHPVTPSFIVERGLNSYMFGVALAVMQTTYFLFSPFWGKMCDYTSTRNIMLICCIGYSVGQTIFMMAHTEAAVMFGRGFAGVFTGGIFTAYLNYIINMTDMQTRGKYLTISATVQTVFGAVGYFVGGMLGLISTESAFLVQVVLLAASGALLYFACLPDSKASLKEVEAKSFLRQANPLSAFLAGRTFMNPAFALLNSALIIISRINLAFPRPIMAWSKP